MHKKFLQLAALLAALSVILGAFGAHSLKQFLPADTLQTFETAVRYQLYHAFALFVAGILYKEFPGKAITWAGYLFVGGIVLFSGSLYLLCYIKYQQLSSLLWVGAVTPLGGLLFVGGWISLLAGVRKN
ncbi:MAG: DUF423 domain-containing protein [Sphingobacteriales bacterium]|nr:DUF423 domain-containing protein [Sphingobacteriales bacterium]